MACSLTKKYVFVFRVKFRQRSIHVIGVYVLPARRSLKHLREIKSSVLYARIAGTLFFIPKMLSVKIENLLNEDAVLSAASSKKTFANNVALSRYTNAS